MQRLVYDWETYWDRQYSLRNMSPAEYILDPRFEVLGCGFKFDDKPAFWVDKPDVVAFLDQIDWSNTFAICHNGLFDHAVLNYVFGKVPKMYGDTMSMARNWWSYMTGRVSLDRLAKHMGRAPKMTTLARTQGRTYDSIVADPRLHAELTQYGPDDCDICHQAFREMIEEGFPQEQLKVIDRMLRMATVPQFRADQTVLAEHLGAVIAEKEAMLAKIGMSLSNAGDKKALMSNEQLALLLLSHGVTVPMKRSPTTGEETYAFAKTDKEFTDLLEHENPMVQAIVAARLGIKSTMEETRTQRFIAVGNCAWPWWIGDQAFPIALKYSGAHTHRFSGDWKMNAQNLGRDSRLREAVAAPPGKKVVAADARQVEARLNAGFARLIAQQRGAPFSDMIQTFAQGKDLYSLFASTVFGFPVNELEHKRERFIGKVGILSLGYGASWPVFMEMVRVQSGGKTVIDPNLASKTVELYRASYPEIPHLWRCAGDLIPFMANAREDQWIQFGPLWVGRHVIVLPNGNRLNYLDLRQEYDEERQKWNWWYTFGDRKKKIYGSKLVENIIQALAFLLIIEADMRVAAATNNLLQLAHQVHDELIYCAPAQHAEVVLELAKREISRAPEWMPWLPLAASGGIGDNYAETKG